VRRSFLLGWGAAAAVALLFLALFELLEKRVQTGDIYPVYSSLRSDAAGTKAYFESVSRLDGFSTERRFDPLRDFHGSGATLLLFGVPPGPLVTSVEVASSYETIAAAGNRLVLTLPVCTVAAPADAAKQRAGSLRWTLSWDCVKREDAGSQPAPDHYVFTRVGNPWTVIAWDRKGMPVAVERRQGSGSLVIVTDTYAFTNEALLRARQIGLLTGALGDNGRVVFDEHHLGLAARPGVVSLARQYRLHWFAAGLLLLAALFIWRNSTSFLPPLDRETAGDEVPGRDAATGLTNLLERTIPKADLISTCAAEWKRSLHGKNMSDQVARVTEIARSIRGVSEPVETYGEIAQLLSEGRKR
jgi:hypothetical protein